MRTVAELFPETLDGTYHLARERCMSLLSSQTERDYHELLDLIAGMSIIYSYKLVAN